MWEDFLGGPLFPEGWSSGEGPTEVSAVLGPGHQEGRLLVSIPKPAGNALWAHFFLLGPGVPSENNCVVSGVFSIPTVCHGVVCTGQRFVPGTWQNGEFGLEHPVVAV